MKNEAKTEKLVVSSAKDSCGEEGDERRLGSNEKGQGWARVLAEGVKEKKSKKEKLSYLSWQKLEPAE